MEDGYEPNLRLSVQVLEWSKGLPTEIAFWERYLATGGLDWPAEFRALQNPDRQFDTELLRGMRFSSIETLKMLDVGAGPLTVLGPDHQGKRLDITACDPLAPVYAMLLEKYAVTRPVRTLSGFVEDLSAFFAPGSFDFVHCRNALDHAFDPLRGIEELLIVTRVGGKILLRHHPNEGQAENYHGLHQWNFDEEDGQAILWNRERRCNLGEIYKDQHDIRAERKPGTKLIWIEIFKNVDTLVDLGARHRLRLQGLLDGILPVLAGLATGSDRQNGTPAIWS